MLSLRRTRLLPPYLLYALNQHLAAFPARALPAAPVHQTQRTNVTSLLSRVGLTSREEKFKQALEKAVERAQDPQTWTGFPGTYNSLLNQYRNLKITNGPLPFLGHALSQIMLNLTRTRTPNRIVNKFVSNIFDDIRSGQWNTPLTPEHYLALIRSRAQNEDFQGAEACLQECIDNFPFSSIPSRVFIVLLSEYRRYNDYESVWRVYERLKGTGRVLDRRVYDVVQDVIINSPTPFFQQHILKLQADFDAAQLGPAARLNLLLATFLTMGQVDEADKAAEKLRAVLENTPAIRFSEYRGWEALIKYALLVNTAEATREVMQAAKRRGYIPYPSLLHRVIIEHDIRSLERLQQCESALTIDADTIAWSLVIHKILANEGVDAALLAYEESKRRGITPAAYMLHPLMRALCGGHLRKELQWRNVERALNLYGDLSQAMEDFNSRTNAESREDSEYPSPAGPPPASKEMGAEEDVPSPSAQRLSPPRVWPGPDSMIYDTLLRAIAQLARLIDATEPLPHSQVLRQTMSHGDGQGTSDSQLNRANLWKLALTLLDDMRQLSIPSSSMSTTAIIILAMRIAPTFHDAFQVYRAMVKGDRLISNGGWTEDLEEMTTWSSGASHFASRFDLNATSYENIIRGFCTLKPKREGGVLIYPPADLYLEMVKDMQMAGYRITEDVYMTFLHRLGRQARSLRLWEKESFPYSLEVEEVEGGTKLEDLDPSFKDPAVLLNTRHAIMHGIRTMHNHIVLNAGITPSIDLLNALLDAYNKVAAVHDAFKVWDTIFLARIYNTQSVSIILDTCGWAKVGNKASQIWHQLVLREFPFNKNNWDSRVECLCRVGKLDEALKVVCLEMPTQNRINANRRERGRLKKAPLLAPDGQLASSIASRAQVEAEEKKNDITPDVKTLGVLFSFATRTNQVEEVKQRVKRYLPGVWQKISYTQKGVWLADSLDPMGEEEK